MIGEQVLVIQINQVVSKLWRCNYYAQGCLHVTMCSHCFLNRIIAAAYVDRSVYAAVALLRRLTSAESFHFCWNNDFGLEKKPLILLDLQRHYICVHFCGYYVNITATVYANTALGLAISTRSSGSILSIGLPRLTCRVRDKTKIWVLSTLGKHKQKYRWSTITSQSKN